MSITSFLFPNLEPGEVHLWWGNLAQSPEVVEQLAGTLSEEEKQRAGRYYFERDRTRFTVGRGLLRALLGHYLGRNPASVALAYNHRGKVKLAESPDLPDLRFNLSHSGQLVTYAFTLGCEVGIDLEEVRPMSMLSRIAERFFSDSEIAAFSGLMPEQQLEAFFNGWTRKEAYIKACGDGLEQHLDRFDVTLKPGEPARLLRVEGHPEAPARWTLNPWSPASGYIGAVAVESRAASFKTYQLTLDLIRQQVLLA